MRYVLGRPADRGLVVYTDVRIQNSTHVTSSRPPAEDVTEVGAAERVDNTGLLFPTEKRVDAAPIPDQVSRLAHIRIARRHSHVSSLTRTSTG